MMAASPTAADGSTTTLSVITSSRTAVRIAASLTVTIRTSAERIMSKFRRPGRGAVSPSAIVGGWSTSVGSPASSERTIVGTRSGCTPTISIARPAVSAARMAPASRPPPEHGTTSRSVPGSCSSSSSVAVAAPATT